MDHGLLIASSHGAGHGPQMHGPVFLVLMALAVVAGVVVLIRKLRAPKGSDPDSPRDARREDVSDPGPGTPSGPRPG